MFDIEATDYGYKVRSSGSFSMNEIEQLKLKLLRTLSAHNGPFSLLLDSRHIIPPPPEVMNEFWDLHKNIWQLSCLKIVFVVNSPVAKGQVIQMQQIASIGRNERVIDATKEPDWEEKAIAWLTESPNNTRLQDGTNHRP